jgi:hypothetical protein
LQINSSIVHLLAKFIAHGLQGITPYSINLHTCFHIHVKFSMYMCIVYVGYDGVATPLWPSVGVKPNTPKVGDLESSGTPECLEFDSKAQNTSHWNVLGVIGKVLKRRYLKWPRIGHLDICRPSYGQKKGRESNWQFDSWPLKVGNRPLPDLRIKSATRRWKDLDDGYNFGSNLVAIKPCSQEFMSSQSPGTPARTVSGQFRDSDLGVPGKRAIWM